MSTIQFTPIKATPVTRQAAIQLQYRLDEIQALLVEHGIQMVYTDRGDFVLVPGEARIREAGHRNPPFTETVGISYCQKLSHGDRIMRLARTDELRAAPVESRSGDDDQ